MSAPLFVFPDCPNRHGPVGPGTPGCMCDGCQQTGAGQEEVRRRAAWAQRDVRPVLRAFGIEDMLDG